MSLIDLRPTAELFGLLGVLDHDDGPFGDGIALSEAERQEVRAILLDVAQRLTDHALSIDSMRRRLGAIVESLIGVADALDGDPDLEDGADQEAACEDEGAQCEDEGSPDDNGMADADGAAEQGFPHCGGFSARSIS
ncbi:MAG: hypothetical protein J0I42_18170 [Bosea sp.]|uniref:hypothetical protein n=1 Tax=Bosea sp. (in: a-proteobacteria) TaxID=1871050 RepID=UPI001AC681DB|nr:hypothetical protein [Bosea sp. (in: a-proteobacteria)]MBN9453869.1 hypothetical protein [Bosea sp. (in: a-proteobacteria)]